MPRPRTPSASSPASAPVLVMGAGAIGCYLGGCLQAAGCPVVFIARPRVQDELRRHGLTVSDLDGRHQTLAPGALALHGSVPPGLSPSLVLLTVKSGATAAAATELAASLPAGTAVLSMQNGLGNADAGRAAAPALHWLAGMVPFNVAALGAGRYHRGSEGDLAVQDDAAVRAAQPVFTAAGHPLDVHADLRPVQWGKLLLNLNNPVNALSGRPLREELMTRGYRRCLAALQDETLGLLRLAGIRPARLAAVAPARLPALLRLPDFLFHRLASRMLRIDAHARSSMADDLAAGRSTEIGVLCGEVVRLAASLGREAPLNARMVALVEAWPGRPQPLAADALCAALGI